MKISITITKGLFLYVIIVSFITCNVSASEFYKRKNEEGEMCLPVYQFLADFDLPSIKHVLSPKYISANIPQNVEWLPNGMGQSHEIKITKILPPYIYAETKYYTFYGYNKHSYKFMVRKEGDKYYIVPTKSFYSHKMLFVEPYVDVKSEFGKKNKG